MLCDNYTHGMCFYCTLEAKVRNEEHFLREDPESSITVEDIPVTTGLDAQSRSST